MSKERDLHVDEQSSRLLHDFSGADPHDGPSGDQTGHPRRPKKQFFTRLVQSKSSVSVAAILLILISVLAKYLAPQLSWR